MSRNLDGGASVEESVKGALADARHTGALRLDELPLRELPEGIRELKDLRELIVTNCGIRVVPDWLCELNSLKRIDLNRNPVRTLPSDLSALSELRALGLSQTALGDGCDAIGDLSGLEVLSLAGSGVTNTPWIHRLRRLRVLDLGGNRCVDVSDTVAALQELTHLYLWGHELRELPAVIRSLPNLQVLEVSRRGSVDLNDEADEYRARWREAFDHLSGLIGSLGDGRIEELPGWLVELPALRALFVGGQQLETVPELPPTLEELWLGGNGLERIPATVVRHERLRVLDLHGNELTDLPTGLRRLRRLRYLDLRDNPLSVPPEVIATVAEPQRILDFLWRVEGPTRRLDEAKLLVVGEGSVGKTSLIKRLVSGDFSPDEQKTDGIEVQRWNLDVTDLPIVLNVWDFGGQEIMHATHQFFLTKRSLYILVIDARQGEDQNRIEYWLKLIQSFGGSSPVVIVGNKTEQSVLDIDERGLKAKYPNVIDILPVSCQTAQGMSTLKGRLAAAIEQMPHVRDELPAPYFDVKQELERLDDDYVTYADYEKLCARHGVHGATARESLVGFLHDLGTVLCFRDDPRLSDTNILNPEWVTGGVYAILNSHLAAQRKGLLRWKDVEAILDVSGYPSERRTFIVDVMKRFELCYESDGVFLIPDLLTKQEPDTGNWDGALTFEIKYDVLPSSVISRLIVRMHLAISKATVWRTGLVVAMDGNRGLVKGDREDAVVRIAIDGPASGRRGLLTAIRSELRAIASTIPGLEGEERVPVPGHPSVLVPYAHLLDLEAAGHETVVPQGLVASFLIRDLLAGVETPEARTRELMVARAVAVEVPATPNADVSAWTPGEAMRLLAWLVIALVSFVVVFVIAAKLVGTAAAAGITAAALLATVAIAAIALRSAGRLSEEGFLTALREVLARARADEGPG